MQTMRGRRHRPETVKCYDCGEQVRELREHRAL